MSNAGGGKHGGQTLNPRENRPAKTRLTQAKVGDAQTNPSATSCAAPNFELYPRKIKRGFDEALIDKVSLGYFD